MAIFLSLGSNEGDRKAMLRRAFLALEESGVEVIRRSPIYETEPWGVREQPFFLNACAEVSTTLSPEELLGLCQAIEVRLGRLETHEAPWGPRPIDIDILLFHEKIMKSPTLTIPHPHLHERRFVLQPLADVAPDFIHPILKKSVRALLKECSDNGIVRSAA